MEPRAAIYSRISNDREGRALGVERQEEDCRALAAQLGLTVTGVFVDNDISASTRSRKPRPRFEDMIGRAEAGEFTAILAWSTSRLTRRPLENERIISLGERLGVRVHTVKSGDLDFNSARGRRRARDDAARDAEEAEETGERVARAAQQRARKGEQHGGSRPFGYGVKIGTRTVRIKRVDRQTGTTIEEKVKRPVFDYDLVVPDEARELAGAYRDLLAGVPLNTIARTLNSRGVVTATGSRWANTTLSRALRNPRNAGLSVHSGKVVGPGSWPAIVDRDTFEAARTILTDPSRRLATGNKAAYLLSGLALCGKCGRMITSGGVKRSSGQHRHIYVCRQGKCVGRRQDWVDQFVSDVVVERLSRPDARDLLVAQGGDQPDVTALRVEAHVLRRRLDDLAATFAEGGIDKSQLRTGTEKLRARLAEVEAAQMPVSRVPVLVDLVGADNVRETWEALPLDRQRAVVATLLTVTILPSRPGKKSFDADSIRIEWK